MPAGSAGKLARDRRSVSAANAAGQFPSRRCGRGDGAHDGTGSTAIHVERNHDMPGTTHLLPPRGPCRYVGALVGHPLTSPSKLPPTGTLHCSSTALNPRVTTARPKVTSLFEKGIVG